MATEYRMTCYNNIEQVLKRNNLTFKPGEGPLKNGTLDSSKHPFDLVGWRETETLHVVEVTDYMTGRIYTLIGDVTDAEALAVQIASLYANGAG